MGAWDWEGRGELREGHCARCVAAVDNAARSSQNHAGLHSYHDSKAWPINLFLFVRCIAALLALLAGGTRVSSSYCRQNGMTGEEGLSAGSLTVYVYLKSNQT